MVTLADEPTVTNDVTRLAGSNVLYMTQDGQIGGPGPRDIWTVNINGTGKHVLANSAEDEIIRDAIGPWMLYDVVPTTFPKLSDLASVQLDGTGRQIIAPAVHTIGSELFAFYERQAGSRAVFSRGNDLFSILPDGTDLRQLTTIPRGPNGEITFLGTGGTVGTQVIYSVFSTQSVPDLFAVPVTGGPVVTLADGPEYKWLGAVVGSRVVYHRCAVNPSTLFVGQCNIYSVQSDGSGTVALSTHPDNEIVQGVIGSQVIVRRNRSGFDELYSINADGSGGEIAILTLSVQSDFVEGIVGSRVILTRATGLWSIHADGSSLVQLTAGTDRFGGASGAFVCFERGPSDQRDLWSVAADGSAPAVPIATTDADEYFVISM